VAAAGLMLAGCGGGARRGLPLLRITERDFHIQVPHHVPAGNLRLVLTNKGPVSHELFIARAAHGGLPLRADGFTVDEDALRRHLVVTLQAAGPSVRYLNVHLAPGRYIVFCNMAGHAASGMQSPLEVG
jgi:uncharacterized cupredoxin-like copper-binding protein